MLTQVNRNCCQNMKHFVNFFRNKLHVVVPGAGVMVQRTRINWFHSTHLLPSSSSTRIYTHIPYYAKRQHNEV